MDTVARVYELAAERNLTVYQLTRQNSISYNTIKRAKERNGQLSVDTIELFCKAFGITLCEFFSSEDD